MPHLGEGLYTQCDCPTSRWGNRGSERNTSQVIQQGGDKAGTCPPLCASSAQQGSGKGLGQGSHWPAPLTTSLALAVSPVVGALWFGFSVKGMHWGFRSLPAHGIGMRLTPCMVHVRNISIFLSPRLLLPSLPLSEKAMERISSGEDQPERRKGKVSWLHAWGEEAYFVTVSAFLPRLSACSDCYRSPP